SGGVHPLINYIPTISLKAGLPFVVICLLHRGRYGAAFSFIVAGSIYGASLMQKALPLYPTIPPALYLIMRGQYAKSAIAAMIAVAWVVFLVITTNPDLRMTTTKQISDASHSTAEALTVRVGSVPGLVVKQWFDVFPAVFKFEQGCGYR